ncbi:MAG: hypothetical protein WCA04_11485 [Geobacteraceae bacterium]
MSCQEDLEWVVLEEVWAVLVASEAVGWEVRLRPVLVGSVSAPPVDTGNPTSGECHAWRESARSALLRWRGHR